MSTTIPYDKVVPAFVGVFGTTKLKEVVEVPDKIAIYDEERNNLIGVFNAFDYAYLQTNPRGRWESEVYKKIFEYEFMVAIFEGKIEICL